MRQLIFTLAFFIPVYLFSQEQNPPYLKWKKINTPHFEIVFPKEVSPEAQRVANTLEYLYEPDSKTLKTKPPRISVFLYNQSTVSNGFVKIMPWMSAFYLTPMQNALSLGSDDWIQTLAVHEFRHVVQFHRTNRNITRIASLLFGDIGQGLSFFSIPPWYWEGDAVGNETALSDGGRGRLPVFDMHIRTLLLSDINYRYNKAHFLSYKDYYPDHYTLGYEMTTHVKRNYGTDAWPKVIERTTFVPFWPWVFSRSLKKVTGRKAKFIYKDTMHELDSLWRNQMKGLDFTKIETINTSPKKLWTNYTNPQFLEDGSMIAKKSGMDMPVYLVQISPEGTESLLNQIDADYITTNNNKVVWSREVPDLRWGLKSFSVVVVYDLTINTEKEITTKSKLFAPAISPDGQKIAAVEFTAENKCSLVILDAETGSEIERFPSPNNDFFRTPRWSGNGTKLVFTRTGVKGQALTMLDLDSKIMVDLIPYSSESISRPVFYKDFILFNSPYSGVDNIYAFHIGTKERYQVVSSQFGAFNPSVSFDEKTLLFQDYQVKGNNIAKIDLDPKNWKKLEQVRDKNIRYYEPLIEQEQGKSILGENVPSNTYEVKNYNKVFNGLNFHSYGPYLYGNDLALVLKSDNKLNTSSILAGIALNGSELVAREFIRMTYSGLYPVFNLEASTGKRSEMYQVNEKNPHTGESTTKDSTDIWNENTVNLMASVPLNFSRGIYQTYLNLGAGFQRTYITEKELVSDNENGNGSFTPVSYTVDFTRSKTGSYRDIQPRLGQEVYAHLVHTPLEEDYSGNFFSVSSNLYFPGFFNHDGWKIQGAYEKQWNGDYHFQSDLFFVRGYNSKFYDDFYEFGLNYAFPFWYPDWSFGPFIHFKRFKANLFYDYGKGTTGEKSKTYQSGGLELTTNVNLLNLPYELDLGIRLSYLPGTKEIIPQLMFFGFGF